MSSAFILAIIVGIFWIIIWLLNRKCKTSADMNNERNVILTQCPMIPNTDRKTIGSNWKSYQKNFSQKKVEGNKSISYQTEVERNKNISCQLKVQGNNDKGGMSRLPDLISESNRYNAKNKNNKILTKQIAMDCEMVGVGDGTESIIARVSIVNKHGNCVYDKYVRPRERVVDYRTAISGIRPYQLQSGEDFKVVQVEVANILKGRVLIGHALKNDLAVLYLSHPRKYQRDTSRFKPFRQISHGNTPSLKKLAHELLGKEIQTGEHSSVEDARTTMQLYMLYRNKWESGKT